MGCEAFSNEELHTRFAFQICSVYSHKHSLQCPAVIKIVVVSSVNRNLTKGEPRAGNAAGFHGESSLVRDRLQRKFSLAVTSQEVGTVGSSRRSLRASGSGMCELRKGTRKTVMIA